MSLSRKPPESLSRHNLGGSDNAAFSAARSWVDHQSLVAVKAALPTRLFGETVRAAVLLLIELLGKAMPGGAFEGRIGSYAAVASARSGHD